MKKLLLGLRSISIILIFTGSAWASITYTEYFEDPFVSWESDWLGIYSNLQNYYVTEGGPITDRGNNPDGLWVSDGDHSNIRESIITFDAIFGAQLTSFQIDIATDEDAQRQIDIFDINGINIYSAPVVPTSAYHQDPATYDPHIITSVSGISGFSISGDKVEGWVSIDNVVVKSDSGTDPIPEPATIILLGIGFIGLAGLGRKKFLQSWK